MVCFNTTTLNKVVGFVGMNKMIDVIADCLVILVAAIMLGGVVAIVAHGLGVDDWALCWLLVVAVIVHAALLLELFDAWESPA